MKSYSENNDSQYPALNFLQKLGWKHISRERAEQERGGINSNVLLENILETQLKKINSFEYKGSTYPFSEGNVWSRFMNSKIEYKGLKSVK
jgi:type I restriction enzyme, R subunit